MRKSVLFSAGLIAVVLATTAGACDKQTEPFKDAPRTYDDDDRPMDVIRMADGFSNIGFKCVGPDGIYAAYKGDANRASIFVATNDPRCR